MFNYLNIKERTATRLSAVMDSDRVLALNPRPAPPGRAGNYSDVVRLYREADGKCGICGAVRGKRNHALDHCHETQKLRGVLCGRCNTGLGMFGDDPARLRAAAAYLERTT